MDCPFCKIAAGEIDSQIVHSDEHAVAFRDLNPQAPTHILVIPRRHIATLNDAEDADRELLGHLVHTASRVAASEGLDADGYRVVMNCNRGGGQTVFHTHLHLLGGRQMTWPPG